MAQAKMDFIVNTRVDKTAFVELKREIQALRGLTEKDLINFGSASDFQEAKKQLAAIKSSATTVEAALNKAFSPKLGTVSLTRFNNELKKIDLQGLANNFSKAGAAGTAAFRSLTTNVLTTKIQVKETHKLLDDMGKTMSNTIKWGISSSAWNSVTGSFQKAYNYVKDLDRSLNDIRIVSGKSAEEMERFAIQANRAAKTLGSTTRDYTDASLIYYQQGLPEEEVIKRTNTTIKMANVLGTNAEEVSDYMTSIWNNFDDGSKSIEYYADVITKLGAATASSAEEISTGLEKFSAIAKTTGLSYEYATAALTTVTAKTRQSAEVVGTAFKTLFARIQDLELGNTLDDGTTLGKYSEALYKVGINIKDSNGEMKKMDDILDEMGKKWATLGDAEKAALAQTVAGTRQYTQLVALMDGWDDFQKNLNTANNATGELNKQQATYLESTQAHLDKLSASAERLYKSLIDSEGLNGLIDIFSGLVTGVAEYTEAIGDSKSALLQLGSVLTKVFGRSVSQSIATSISNIKKLTEQAEDFNAQTQILQQFKGIQVDDESYQNLLKMAEGVNKYKDTLSEAQMEEANAIMSGYNDAVNARDKWQEAKTYAENYYKFFTEEEAGSLDHTFSNEQLEEYFKKLNTKIGEYEQNIGSSKKEINQNIEDREVDIVGEYINSATRMIEDKIIKNEKLEIKLKAILENYSKAGEPITEEGDKKHLSDKQIEALKNFGDVYGEIADNILKDTKKVKDTFKDAQKGMSDSQETAVEEMGKNWDDFINKIDIQSMSQYFVNITGNIMSIASAMNSFGNIPSIWKNEDLSTGEKILQTIMAATNTAQGLAATYQLIHNVAGLISTDKIKHITLEASHAGLIKQSTDNQKEQAKTAKDNNDLFKDEINTVQMATKEIHEKKDAIEQEQQISSEASTEEILDETTFANRVAISTEALHQKNKALGSGVTEFDSLDEIGGLSILTEQEVAKHNIMQFLKDNGYTGKYSQIPTMSKERLQAITKDEKSAEHLSKIFKGITGQAHAIARGERESFDIRNKKGLEELIEFLNGLKNVQKESEPTKTAMDDIAKAGEKAGKTIKEITNPETPDKGGNKKGGLFGGLKSDIATIEKFLKGIPPQAYLAVAAITAIAATIYLIAEAIETDKERDKRLQEQVDKTTESYNKAVESAEELNNTISNYQSGIDGLKGLTKGTVEYYEAIINANKAAQELIDKLGLIAGKDYTLSLDGLIQINEESLKNAAKEAQKEIYRRQAAVYSAKEEQTRESTGGMYGAVKKARKDVNKELQKAGIRKSFTYEEMEQILQGKEAGGFRETIINSNQSPARLNPTSPASLENKKLDELILVNEKNNDLIKENTLDITGVIAKYAASYKANNTQADSFALAAADQSIRGYGTDEQVEYYENATSTGQNLMQQYVVNQKNKNKEDLKDINIGANAVGLGLSGAISGAIIGGIPGAIGGAIGGALGGALGSSVAKKKEEKKLKKIYAQEALGYNINEDGEWYDQNNQLVNKDEQKKILKDIDLTTAREAYKNGDYFTDESLKYIQSEMKNYNKGASDAGFDKESSRYISEAMTAAKSGLDYDYSLLNEEEMAYAKEALGEYSDALTAVSDAQKRLEQDTQNYDTELDTQAKALETSSAALKVYHKSLASAEKVSNELNKTTAEAVGSTYGFNKAWNNAVDTFEDVGDAYDMWLDSLKSGEEIPYDAADAVGELMTSLEKVLGFDLDTDFMKDNSELIKDFLSEDKDAAEAAYKELKQIALENTLSNMGDYITDVKGFVSALEGLKAGENLSADYANQLTAMLQNTNMTKEQLENLFASMNLKMPDIENSPEWEAVEEEIPGTSTVHRYVGDYPTGKLDRDGNMKTAHVNYQWTETVDPQKLTYWKPKKDAKPTYTGAGSSTSKTSFARAYNANNNNNKGGGGGAKEAKHEDRLEDELDRYHDVNVELKKISNSLDTLESNLDNLVGQSKIDNLTEQFRLLNKEIKTTDEKISIAKGEMAELQGKLSAQGMTFAVDGTISNYAAVYNAQLNQVNSVIDRYNAMSATQQETYQDTLDNAKKQFEKFKENLDRYDELFTDEIPELKADIQDAINKQIELKLEAFNQEIEIRLEMAEAERDWNKFFNKVIKDIDEDDILGNAEAKLEDFMSYYKDTMKGVVQVNTQHVQDILADLKAMDEGLAGKFYSKDGVDNRAQALEDLKNYYEQLMSDLEEIHDLQDEIHESYVDMIDEAQEKFDEQVETFETINNLLEHDKNVISMIYGEESYSALSQFYDRQEENYNKQLDFQRQQVEFWKMQMETAEKGSDAWNAAKENWLSAVDAWNSSIETAIQNLQDKYLNAINAIFQNLNNQVTNGMGLDFIETEWDLINQNADQYLDTVNAIYKVQELQNKYLDAIDKTDSPAQQKKLNDLMQQETNYLREQDKLSEYDLERANLKYELALKQIALEEAQQNKTQLRLRRDSQGNYTYQYTQNDDQIASIQKEITDLYNQLYNLDAEQYRGNLDELYSVWSEFQERMAEAAQINDPEKRAAKELLIKQQYSDLINGLVEKNENLQANLYQSTMSHLFDLYDQNTANYEDMSVEQKEILDQFINAETNLTGAAFDNMFDLYNINIEQFKSMTDEQQDILMNSMIPQWSSGIQQMADKIAGEGGFTGVCKNAFEELDQATEDYMTGLEELQKNANVSFEDVKNGIDNVVIETEKLLDNNSELINQYSDEIDAIRGVINELDDLITKYKDAEAAAKAASEEAYKYWQEEQNRNASADNTIDAPIEEEEIPITNPTPVTPAPVEPPKPSLSLGSYVSVKPGTKWYADSWGGGSWGYARAGSIAYTSSGPYGYNIGGLGWVRKSDIIGYDTGGYTGNWNNNNGRLAMLHQKELVLNANDTNNMLNAITILRDITANLGATLLNKMASISAGGASSIGQGLAAAGMEQNVVINAEFPNATNSREIEDALNNLVNRASQYITK